MVIYFAGTMSKDLHEFMLKNKVDRLMSQLEDKKSILKCIDDINNVNNYRLFIDSGAFTAHRKDIYIDVDEYIDFLNKYSKSFEIFAQLDTIPGKWGQPKTREDLLKTPELCWQNYLYMRGHLLEPYKLLPIFHQGEDFKWLSNMLEYVDKDNTHIPYIGLSCNKELSSKDWKIWFERCFDIIEKSSNPNVKTHAFGMTSISTLRMFNFTSCDSTSWIMLTSNGNIITDYGTILVSDAQKNNLKNFENLHEEIKQHIIENVNKFGFDMESVKTDYRERGKYNLMYLKTNIESIKYKKNNLKKKNLLN